jgi:putative ABC transport system permease protein
VRLKYAIRALAASPTFTIGSILCLSVGLALTIAAFSLINAVLFRSMPGIQDQAALRNIWIGAAGRFGPEIAPPTIDEYHVFRDSLADIAMVAASAQDPVAVQVEGTAIVTRAVFASPNYFQVLGTVPIAGRLPDAAGNGAVIGERWWRAHLGGRPDAIGRTVTIAGQSFQIVGIAPAAFVGASTGEFDDDPTTTPSIWLPLASHARTVIRPGNRPAYLRMTARLVAGGSEEMLTERALSIAGSLAAAAGRTDPFVRVRPIHMGPFDETSEVALAMAGVMVVPLGILAIGCANVANLLLARGASRSRDIAVRLALGASRARIVGELMTESLILAGAAAIVATALCALAIALLERWMPLPIAVDWRVAGFAAAAAAVTALLFGLLPAVSLARLGVILRIQDRRPVRTWTRRTLAGLQLALSTALLVIAALFVRTVTGIAAGERADEAYTLTASFAVHLAKYDRVRLDEFETAMLDRVRGIGGVRHAGFGPGTQYEPLLVSTSDNQQPLNTVGGGITDGWLGAVGARIVAGRDFTAPERRGAPAVTLVNDALAARLFPNGDALGQAIAVSTANGPRYDVQIVGIIGGERSGFRGARPRPIPAVYLPSAISVRDQRMLRVRTEQPAAHVIPTIRALTPAIAPEVAVMGIASIAEARQSAAQPYRLLAQGMGAAGTLALLLAAFGLFSLLTYLVAQRRRELGIRLALGARPRDVFRLIVGESTVVALGGAAVGGITAALVATATRSMFIGVSPADPVSFVAAATVLIAVALAASAPPALRAARTDPSEVLRAE